MDKLLGTTAPELLLQGHQRPVRDLLDAADRLASTALSNAPAAELHLRGLMSLLYLSEGPSLMDSAAASRADEAHHRAVAKRARRQAPDLARRLPHRRRRPLALGRSRPNVAWPSLRHSKRNSAGALRRLTARIAWSLAQEGIWHVWKGEAELAVEKLTEALRIAPADTRTAISISFAFTWPWRSAIGGEAG